tara:strand:+ start:368 stop:592 length:225 start_codon:yes stop_codon:yes gene_type:complete
MEFNSNPANIKTLRLTLGMSQDVFAETLGVGIASVRRWEAGKAVPITAHQEKINQLSNLDAVKIIKEGSNNESR